MLVFYSFKNRFEAKTCVLILEEAGFTNPKGKERILEELDGADNFYITIDTIRQTYKLSFAHYLFSGFLTVFSIEHVYKVIASAIVICEFNHFTAYVFKDKIELQADHDGGFVIFNEDFDKICEKRKNFLKNLEELEKLDEKDA